MNTKHTLDDYKIGEKFVTPGRTITESDIVSFAGLSGDFHPLHTDSVYAEKTQFGERIAHGMLVLSIGTALPYRLGPNYFLPESFIAFYGMENVRFTAPVKIGDTIRFEGEVTGIDMKDERRGVLTWTGRILNQEDRLCCSLVMKLFCGRNTEKL
ncbi:MAG TPA: MaoC/PaaZ C-terminal domain-containing protein [Leptospiraceae bacterium]|nr:MaoC/PaaZ C-terminal domain-containing protein [Leptospiraceae bacterium]HMY67775.1 MaoC/PaaZ C-terminal domain-containing protein [Leptospiraceae bacterium]HNF15804.1 MaoC/PaaZ C-terminal domain-containing protein [Leptospiraceae bacterium]HNF26884.1 MaoC/PaaZ C-terminal domain-containing protein [Leptospiraceae bacterium]HNI99285.1 MaoC/PaaZ C-terminal domain-containing protein [Leptospiraceae bacterium]